MRSLITCVYFFILLQKILAIGEIYLEVSENSIDSSSSSSSTLESISNSSCQDSSCGQNSPSSESSDFLFSSSPAPTSSLPSDSSESSHSSSLSPSLFQSSSSSSSEDLSDEIISSVPCPQGKSLHAKEDIMAIIDQTAKTLSIYQSINDSYNSQAIALRDKHMEDFKQSRNWFQIHPEHLKHILEDLADKRLYIEPIVTTLSLVLAEYYHYEQKFIKRLDKANSLVENFILLKTACEPRCKNKHLGAIKTSNGQDGHICSTLEDLHHYIYSELNLFETKMKVILQDKVTNDDKVFSDKITNIRKNKLKSRKEFDLIVYDILYLQDEYYHLIKDISRANPMSYVYNMSQSIYRIDLKLFELQSLIQKYTDCCRKCKQYDAWLISQHTGVFSENGEINNKNILDDLLNEKFTNIESSINKDYANIFQELNTLLRNTEEEDVIFDGLKPIQNEVIAMLRAERAKFNELRKCAPQSEIDKLINLSESSLKLLSNVTEEVCNVKRAMLKHIHLY